MFPATNMAINSPFYSIVNRNIVYFNCIFAATSRVLTASLNLQLIRVDRTLCLTKMPRSRSQSHNMHNLITSLSINATGSQRGPSSQPCFIKVANPLEQPNKHLSKIRREWANWEFIYWGGNSHVLIGYLFFVCELEISTMSIPVGYASPQARVVQQSILKSVCKKLLG